MRAALVIPLLLLSCAPESLTERAYIGTPEDLGAASDDASSAVTEETSAPSDTGPEGADSDA